LQSWEKACRAGFCSGQTRALPATAPKHSLGPYSSAEKDVPGKRQFWENNS